MSAAPLDPPVYLDHHATTPVDPRVLGEMLPWLGPSVGNPASSHLHGQRAAAAVGVARRRVADLVVGGAPARVVWTSGATEACNLALRGALPPVGRGRAPHIVTTSIEHSAVAQTCEWLRSQGYALTVVPVGRDGVVDASTVIAALRPTTAVVAVMAANNEIGTVQPLDEIYEGVRASNARWGRRALVFSDAVQALGRVDAPQADMVSVSAHKMYGPQGVGALVIRGDFALARQQHGGTQEDGMRAGTVPVPMVVGLGRAAELMTSEGVEEAQRVGDLRDRLAELLIRGVGEGLAIHGAWGGERHARLRLPGNLNVAVHGVCPLAFFEEITPRLSVSSGAACRSGLHGDSPVLRAIGAVVTRRTAVVRFGVGRFNTADDIDFAADLVTAAARRLRGQGSR